MYNRYFKVAGALALGLFSMNSHAGYTICNNTGMDIEIGYEDGFVALRG